MEGKCHEEIAGYRSFAWCGCRSRLWLCAGARRRLCGRKSHGRWEKPDHLHRSVEAAATALYRTQVESIYGQEHLDGFDALHSQCLRELGHRLPTLGRQITCSGRFSAAGQIFTFRRLHAYGLFARKRSSRAFSRCSVISACAVTASRSVIALKMPRCCRL